MNIRKVDFQTVLPIWRNELWPDRKSPIESHSAMTWPYGDADTQYCMKVFDYPATFWAAYHDDEIVGVNSGHRTAHNEYRSRGIWVHPDYRRKGISRMLFLDLEEQAIMEGCHVIWSIPRITGLPAYEAAGFQAIGDFFKTETSEGNVYAYKLV